MPLLVTVLLAVLYRVQKAEKKAETTPEIIWKVKARLDRNPNISTEDMQHILKNELGRKPLKFQKVQEPIERLKKVILERSKELLRLHESGLLPNLVFSDVKPFQIEQFENKQNDWVYLPKRSAENLHLGLATRTQAPPLVMVWVAVNADGRSSLVFTDRGSK